MTTTLSTSDATTAPAPASNAEVADSLAVRPRTPRVAMIGAGQLARMTHRAAIDLGIELRVLAVSEDDPAVLAGTPYVLGRPDDLDALLRLADGADVVTFDHEQVPHEHLRALEAAGVRVAPSARAKRFAQDKVHQRVELRADGFPVPPFALARTPDMIESFGRVWGWPLVAKAPRGGYDGRGVSVVDTLGEAVALLETSIDGLLLEPLLQIDRELSVVVARSATGETAVYPVVETVQEDGMCREVIAPAEVEPWVAAEATELGVAIAEHIGAVGIVAIELFLTADGLLVNELALRPHNSGHWTIDGAATSQFAQHLRAVLGLPLGETELLAPAVVMVNVVGAADGDPDDPPSDAEGLAAALAVPGAAVHRYGKAWRPERKLGHVTVRSTSARAAAVAAHEAAERLQRGGRA